MWMLQSFLEGGTKYLKEKVCVDKTWSRDYRKGHAETAPPGDLYYIQTPNLGTIADAKKYMLTSGA